MPPEWLDDLIAGSWVDPCAPGPSSVSWSPPEKEDPTVAALERVTDPAWTERQRRQAAAFWPGEFSEWLRLGLPPTVEFSWQVVDV
jgi:hypothetical protein